MILLDTNHLSILKYRFHPRTLNLSQRLRASGDSQIGIPVIAYEEQLRGWLAEIAKNSDPRKQVAAYSELSAIARFMRHWEIIDFDESSATQFAWLRSLRLRVGTMDLKMASIALRHDALLLTANHRDFSRIPGLRFQNWLE